MSSKAVPNPASTSGRPPPPWGLVALSLALGGCQPNFNGDWNLSFLATPEGGTPAPVPYPGLMTLIDNGLEVQGQGVLDVGQPCLLPFTVGLAESPESGDLGSSAAYDLTFSFDTWTCGDDVLVEGGYAPLPFQATYERDFDTLTSLGDQVWFPFGEGEMEYDVSLVARFDAS